jgi:REP element-mobilizing transposase RayT
VTARGLRYELTGRRNQARTNRHLRWPSHLAASCRGIPLSITRQHIEQQQRPHDAAT